MADYTIPSDNDHPQPPLRHDPAALLDHLAACSDCGETLVGVKDANGVGWYVHHADVDGPIEGKESTNGDGS